MKNQKVARILDRIADYLEMEGTDFRTKAYRRAAHTVEMLPQDINEIRNKGQLTELPGVGKAIALKIEEILDTGKLQYLEDLKREYPVDIDALLTVEGIGPKTIRLLYKELGIKNLDDLEKEARRHHIRRLKGMGDKSERKILEHLEFARKSRGRRLLGEVLPLARKLKDRLSDLDIVEKVEIAGSLRRMKETIGDMDILVITQHPQKVMDFFTSQDSVEEIIVKGPLKSTVRLEDGFEADLRVFPREEFGSALLYFTGSKEMNIKLRQIALGKKLKLNEYGVFKGEERIASRTEEDMFQALGLPYIPPELRENRGEVEAAQEGELPDLVGYDELKGDLHIHSSWSDGKASILDMAVAGEEKGYEYLAITDHSKGLRIANGLDENSLRKQMQEIDDLNKEMKITILKGVEVNLDRQGRPDISRDILRELDVVVAALHSNLSQEGYQVTQMLIDAMENEEVDIIAHPTGRKIALRKAYDLDMERIFQTAQDTGTVLEVNSSPKRLDLNDINLRQAINQGCKLAVNSDAHSPLHLDNVELGLATARRGWAEKRNVINTLSCKELLKILKH